jgi:hypothetical protein
VSLEIWKSPPRLLRRVARSLVRDKNHLVPIRPGSRLGHGFGPAPALGHKVAPQRCYHDRPHSEVFHRNSVAVLRRSFEEVYRCSPVRAVRSEAFLGLGLLPQTVAGIPEAFRAELSDGPPPKAWAAESLGEAAGLGKDLFSEALLAALKLAVWAYCSASHLNFRCHDGPRFAAEENRRALIPATAWSHRLKRLLPSNRIGFDSGV